MRERSSAGPSTDPSVQNELTRRKRVVIVGAGFAGVHVAKVLEGTASNVTLLDRNNYTLFQPLLYQVAAGALSSAEVASPIRSLIHSTNVEMLLEEVVGVDPTRSCVLTASAREVGYDVLVLAPGSKFNYFGHENWADLAPAPKGLTDAVEIRRRLLLAFEHAEIADDENEQRSLMTFVIVGAGPTGVEMAGAVAELAKATLRRDFRRIDPTEARIVLVEAGARVLASFPEKLGTYAHRVLTEKGVEVLLNTKIEQIDGNGVVAGGRRLESRTVIWGAGVKARPVANWLRVKAGKHGAVKVNRDFTVPGYPNVFVIGDAAEFTDEDGRSLPGLAAVAKQEGQYVGALLRDRLAGRHHDGRFLYRDYGVMATIGRSAAVADIRGLQLTGWLAWLLWGMVHLYFLISFRNRLVVLINWFWAWLTYAHGARVIMAQPAPYARSARGSNASAPSQEDSYTQHLQE